MVKSAIIAEGCKVVSKQRPQIIDDAEKLLLVFINQKQLKGDSLSEALICEIVLDIYGDLVKEKSRCQF